MKIKLSERHIVVVLFVMVLITFSLAQEDSKKMQKGFTTVTSSSAIQKLAQLPAVHTPTGTTVLPIQ